MEATYNFPSTSPISETSEHSVIHSRNLSTVSSVTLHAETLSHSTPYEPLLTPISQSSLDEACDVISHQPRLSPVPLPPRWSQNNLGQSFSRDEKTKCTDSKAQKKSNRLGWVKIGLETVIVVWSLYTMIRYLYAFTIYDSLNSQLAAFGLGVCAGLSFAFTCCSIILSAVNKHLLGRGVFVKSLSSVHSILRYPPTVCFLLPAITNFILVLVWKNTSTIELNLHHRCKIDVDLVWTITHSRCDNLGQPWGVWITLAVVRVAFSLFIIIAFHNVQSSQVIPMFKLSYVKTAMHQRSLSPRHTSKVSSKKFPSIPRFTLKEPIIYRPTEYSSSIKSASQHRLRTAKSRSSGSSEDAPSYSNTDFLPIPNPAQNESTFMERFRRLVSVITQETDDAVAYARASVVSTSCNSQDSAESPTLNESCRGLDEEPHSPEYNHILPYDDQEDDFYGPLLAEGHSDSNYPQPYPADEEIRMMNGYIKRMPTIESMGSRELVGSVGTNHERNGPRPSTMLSWNETDMSGSDIRRRSLTAQAELLYGRNSASEVGELGKQGMSIKMVGSYGSSDTQGNSQGPLPDYDSLTSGSKNSTQSFHTAHSGMDKDDDMKISVTDIRSI